MFLARTSVVAEKAATWLIKMLDHLEADGCPAKGKKQVRYTFSALDVSISQVILLPSRVSLL